MMIVTRAVIVYECPVRNAVREGTRGREGMFFYERVRIIHISAYSDDDKKVLANKRTKT